MTALEGDVVILALDESACVGGSGHIGRLPPQ